MRSDLHVLFCLPVICLSLAAQEPTTAEVETLVKEAIAFAKANGKEAAFK